MASTYRLVMTFKNASGNNVSYSFGYVIPNVEASSVKTLMETMIANGDIYSNPPVSIKSAKIVSTSETSLSISE